jgi:hypothetical protein
MKVQELTDLEVADILANQIELLYQTNINISLLKNEIKERKKITGKYEEQK